MSEGQPVWRDEAGLTSTSAAALIQRHFPLVPCQSIDVLGAGWDSATFRVDGDWVFRFPKRADVVPHLRSEIAILPLLDLPLAIPRFDYIAEPDDAFPYPFVGYRAVPGVPANTLASVDHERMVDALVPFFDALHRTPLDGPVGNARGWAPGDMNSRLDALVPLAGRDPLYARGLAWLRGREDLTGRVLVHGDVGPEHVFVDPVSRVPVAVIDWGDMELTDPAAEWVGIWSLAPELVERRLPELVPGIHTLAILHSLEHARFTLPWKPTQEPAIRARLEARLAHVGEAPSR